MLQVHMQSTLGASGVTGCRGGGGAFFTFFKGGVEADGGTRNKSTSLFDDKEGRWLLL